MPKDTFYNLSDEKKWRIFDSAVTEFAVRRFSEASINQIVKTAGIPWGSFYQYFNDKEDIYLYMLGEIAKEKQKLAHHTEAIDSDADFFETFQQKTQNSLDLGRVRPEYAQIGMLLEMDNSEFITKLRADSVKELRQLIERDKERGLIKAGIDSDLILDMTFTLAMKEYFRIGSDEHKYVRRVKDIIKIIKEGVAV